MNINFKQVLGWILILIGLAIIFWAISSSYYYFTAEKEFPQLFVQKKLERPPLQVMERLTLKH